MSTFSIGDVVRLKSGSPSMTVTSIDTRSGSPTAWTTWFSGSEAKHGDFPVAALEALQKARSSALAL